MVYVGLSLIYFPTIIASKVFLAMFNYLKSGFILLLALFSAASVQAAGGIA